MPSSKPAPRRACRARRQRPRARLGRAPAARRRPGLEIREVVSEVDAPRRPRGRTRQRRTVSRSYDSARRSSGRAARGPRRRVGRDADRRRRPRHAHGDDRAAVRAHHAARAESLAPASVGRRRRALERPRRCVGSASDPRRPQVVGTSRRVAPDAIGRDDGRHERIARRPRRRDERDPRGRRTERTRRRVACDPTSRATPSRDATGRPARSGAVERARRGIARSAPAPSSRRGP